MITCNFFYSGHVCSNGGTRTPTHQHQGALSTATLALTDLMYMYKYLLCIMYINHCCRSALIYMILYADISFI